MLQSSCEKEISPVELRFMNLPATNVNIDKMKATQRYDREPIQHIDNDVIIPKKAIAPDPMMNTRTKSNAENENKIMSVSYTHLTLPTIYSV